MHTVGSMVVAGVGAGVGGDGHASVGALDGAGLSMERVGPTLGTGVVLATGEAVGPGLGAGVGLGLGVGAGVGGGFATVHTSSSASTRAAATRLAKSVARAKGHVVSLRSKKTPSAEQDDMRYMSAQCMGGYNRGVGILNWGRLCANQMMVITVGCSEVEDEAFVLSTHIVQRSCWVNRSRTRWR